MKVLLEVIAIALFATFVAILMVEWAVGCGETYTDAMGVRHSYECVFVK
jgi:nitrogen fixation-related uncharacterized protein